ncbi:MAG: ABC transporter ATP-binding protein [archaeon]
MANIIELSDVKKTYYLGKLAVPILHGISLHIREGEFISIVGHSGSGKSTLLNLIGCLDTPTSGRILISGKDVSKLHENDLAKIRREKIGFVFQKYNLIEKLTALENVSFPMWLRGVPSEERLKKAHALLRTVGLGERVEHRPSELSGGESQRVAIARALSNNPEIILADEPTGNLDSKTSEEIETLLMNLHKKKGVTLILVTHNEELAKKARHRIYLRDGLVLKEERKK